MRLPKFDYRQPASIQEACTILLDQPFAKVLSGGTDLLVNMKHKVETPAMIVSLKGLRDQNYVRKENGILRIGALTPLKKVYNDPFVAQNLPALAIAASSVGSYHHQTWARSEETYVSRPDASISINPNGGGAAGRSVSKLVGINVTSPTRSMCATQPTAVMSRPHLLVMNAEVVLTRKDGSKQVSLESIFSGEGKTPLNIAPGEILTEIVIPEASGGRVFHV